VQLRQPRLPADGGWQRRDRGGAPTGRADRCPGHRGGGGAGARRRPHGTRGVQRAGEALGRGLATLLNLLNLEAIGLCGEPAILSTGVYLDTVRDTLGRRAFSTAADDCDLWIEERTDELEARGAASMVFDHLVDLREPATDT
jgi:hypothetical protein